MKRDHLSECGCCGSRERAFIHNVRHRGIYRRLCTSCVLKNHPGSFCPLCFEVFDDDPPPPRDRAMCLNCPSISHLSCLGTSNSNVTPRYQCPPCSNPKFSFFDIGKSDKRIKGNDGESATAVAGRGINQDLAKQLVAAARIALASMNKAVAVARIEAERRVKEAAVARKRAREALERVVCLVPKENIESKSIAGQQKIKSKTESSFLEEKGVQNQIRADGVQPTNNGASVRGNNGQTRKAGGKKEINGLRPC